MTIRLRPDRLTVPLAATLMLAACHPSDQRSAAANEAVPALPPLAANAASADVATSIARAPAAAALPEARPLAFAYEDAPGPGGYGWIDQADMLLDTIGDAPPDYAFDYDGVEPWAWQTADRYDIYAEPVDDGWRYYYYEPGAFEPFLVRDPAYSYGYRGGRVVAVYGADGRYLDRTAALRQAQAASRYFARANALRAAARDRPRLAIASTRWANQRPAVTAVRRQWDEARTHEAEWQRQRADRQASVAGRAGERTARAAAAARFAAWQQAQFRGPPPRLYDGRPGRPDAQILARREAAARQTDIRWQAQAQAEAGGRMTERAQARNADIGARQAAHAAGEAQARQRAASVRAGRDQAAAAAQQRVRTEAEARQHQQAQQRAAQAQQHATAQAQQRAAAAAQQQRAAQARSQLREQTVRARQEERQARAQVQQAARAHQAAQARQHAAQAAAHAPHPPEMRIRPPAPAAAAAAGPHHERERPGHGH